MEEDQNIPSDVMLNMARAANKYLGLVIAYLMQTDTVYSPAITVASNDLFDSVLSKDHWSTVWEKFSVLIKLAEAEGIDLIDGPILAFGKPIK